MPRFPKPSVTALTSCVTRWLLRESCSCPCSLMTGIRRALPNPPLGGVLRELGRRWRGCLVFSAVNAQKFKPFEYKCRGNTSQILTPRNVPAFPQNPTQLSYLVTTPEDLSNTSPGQSQSGTKSTLRSCFLLHQMRQPLPEEEDKKRERPGTCHFCKGQHRKHLKKKKILIYNLSRRILSLLWPVFLIFTLKTQCEHDPRFIRRTPIPKDKKKHRILPRVIHSGTRAREDCTTQDSLVGPPSLKIKKKHRILPRVVPSGTRARDDCTTHDSLVGPPSLKIKRNTEFFHESSLAVQEQERTGIKLPGASRVPGFESKLKVEGGLPSIPLLSSAATGAATAPPPSEASPNEPTP
ncbi:hypothetical protein JTE90_020940 [Oedothorax gibbosus]|uniref:Uncharacterized protein n=1 Tax=Oedothorax gibbosus TaxID=931172 RepID=A0AAV6VMS8_9ARAC|nr:hypothetical protein JTE90_020940 [Oedothorax gibbosus]